MKLSRKEISGRASTFAVRRIRKWLSRKDLLQAERFGERIGRLAFRVVKRRRKIALQNLALAFPESSEEERLRIAKAHFEHFGRLLCDFLRTDTLEREAVLASVEIDGAEQLGSLIPHGKGAILLTGHFGSWERLAHYAALSGYDMAVVARGANDSEMNDLVLDMRRSAGLEVLARGNAARQILSALKKNYLVGILPDQNSSESFLPFFGKPCGTVLGPGVLALRARAPVYCIFGYRVGPGKYRLRVADFMAEGELAGMTPEDIMMRFNAALETIVREHPEQYLWMHDRWKNARSRGMI